MGHPHHRLPTRSEDGPDRAASSAVHDAPGCATPFHRIRDDDRAAAPTSQAEGMAIPDVARPEYWLRHVSYYLLSAYWLPLEYHKGNPGLRFLPGTSFDTVTALYDFDRRLRLLVLDAISSGSKSLHGDPAASTVAPRAVAQYTWDRRLPAFRVVGRSAATRPQARSRPTGSSGVDRGSAADRSVSGSAPSVAMRPAPVAG